MLLLAYLLPFGGLTHIFLGIYTSDRSKIVLGLFCLLTSIFIMGYLLYQSKKEKRLLKISEKRTTLLVGMFRHIVASCILMIAEFLLLSNFGFLFRYIIAIICLSLVILTAIFEMLKKI